MVIRHVMDMDTKTSLRNSTALVMDMSRLYNIVVEWDMSPLVKLTCLASHLQEYNHLPVLDHLVELDMSDTS